MKKILSIFSSLILLLSLTPIVHASTPIYTASGTLANNGKDKTIKFDQVYKNVDGIKIVVLSGYRDFATASEIILKKPLTLNIDTLAEQYTRYENLNKEYYEEESLEDLVKAATLIKQILDAPSLLTNLNQLVIDEMSEGLKIMLDSLVMKSADYRALYLKR